MPERSRSAVWLRAAQNRVVNDGDEHGWLEIFLPASGICVTRARGQLTLRQAHKWIEVIDPHFRRGVTFETFHDWEDMASYESTARRSLTTWVVANHRSITNTHFLVGSKLVAMGVSAASLATTLVGLSMQAHTTRPPFEDALREALDRHAP